MRRRTFIDGQGRTWKGRVVVPTKAKRWSRPSVGDAGLEAREIEYQAPLGPDFANGWLCFETRGEKRRLAPFPPDWDSMTDAELVTLSELATPSRLPPGRLLE
jgi:hypothetical protein